MVQSVSQSWSWQCPFQVQHHCNTDISSSRRSMCSSYTLGAADRQVAGRPRPLTSCDRKEITGNADDGPLVPLSPDIQRGRAGFSMATRTRIHILNLSCTFCSLVPGSYFLLSASCFLVPRCACITRTHQKVSTWSAQYAVVCVLCFSDVIVLLHLMKLLTQTGTLFRLETLCSQFAG